MKKVFFLLILVAVSFITLTGCNNGDYSSSIKIKLDADLLSDTIWEYDISGDGGVKITEDNDFDCDKDDKECKGNQIFKIEGLSEGKTKITFKCINAVYENVLYEAIYDIDVNSKLKVKESHSGSYFER